MDRAEGDRSKSNVLVSDGKLSELLMVLTSLKEIKPPIHFLHKYGGCVQG
jgi:hypothetical protein